MRGYEGYEAARLRGLRGCKAARLPLLQRSQRLAQPRRARPCGQQHLIGAGGGARAGCRVGTEAHGGGGVAKGGGRRARVAEEGALAVEERRALELVGGKVVVDRADVRQGDRVVPRRAAVLLDVVGPEAELARAARLVVSMAIVSIA